MESDPPISCNKASVQQFPLKKKLFLQYCISFNLHQFTTPKFLFSFTCMCTWHHEIKSNFQFLYKYRQENDWMFSCVTVYNLERQWDHQILWFSQKKIRGTIGGLRAKMIPWFFGHFWKCSEVVEFWHVDTFKNGRKIKGSFLLWALQLTPLQILLIETKNDSRGCGYLKKFEQWNNHLKSALLWELGIFKRRGCWQGVTGSVFLV